jgi:hypothetical protein
MRARASILEDLFPEMTIEFVNGFCPAPGHGYDDDYWPTRRAYNVYTDAYDGEVWLDRICEF